MGDEFTDCKVLDLSICSLRAEANFTLILETEQLSRR